MASARMERLTAERMEQLTADLPTKSAKIRTLSGAGYSRSQIADFLKIRYQHVRNVLVNDARASGAAADGAANASSIPAAAPQTMNVRMGPDGRIVVPAAFRAALGLKEGDALLASLVEDEIRLLTIPAAVRKAQAIVRRYVPEGVSLVDELIAERRREADRESRDA